MWRVWEIPLLIMASHFGIDFLKELATSDSPGMPPASRWSPGNFGRWQSIGWRHVGAIVALVALLVQANRIPVEFFWSLLIGPTVWRRSLVVLMSVIATVYVGGVSIGILVEPSSRNSRVRKARRCRKAVWKTAENAWATRTRLVLCSCLPAAREHWIVDHCQIGLSLRRVERRRRPQGSRVHHHRHHAQFYMGLSCGVVRAVSAASNLANNHLEKRDKGRTVMLTRIRNSRLQAFRGFGNRAWQNCAPDRS